MEINPNVTTYLGTTVTTATTTYLPTNTYTGNPKDAGKPDCEQAQGNPINAGTGNKVQEEVDYTGAGPFSLQLTRSYNSQITNGTGFGVGWRSNFGTRVSTPNASTAWVSRPDGKQRTYTLTGGVWISDSDVTDKLAPVVNSKGETTGWAYTLTDGTSEHFTAAGLLNLIINRVGLIQTLTYSTVSTPVTVAPVAGLLLTVTDPFGRTLNFTYDPSKRVSSMTDPAGGVYTYAYGANSNLISVTYPDSKVRQYVYENTSFPRLLTGIIDENGSRYATWTYNASGNAITSEHGTGVEKVTLTYNTGSTTIVDALGTTRTQSFSPVVGVTKSTSLSQPCASCGGSRATTSYDANGNIASSTDFNGNLTNYSYDLTRNLETSRTEAAGTAQARTISTVWHPTFQLPASITEPGRVTRFVYDNHGNVTQRSVQDTAASTTVTWNTYYSYSATIPGAVLNKALDGPRSDVADLTTSAYYDSTTTCAGSAVGGCRGQLQSVTNALNQITTVTAYDANGRVLTLVDPNNVTIALAYDLRGRLTGRTVGANSTTYGYDNAGQLIRVTLADASQATYTYDAAHRLTDITDSLLNHVHYTLDAMGNRTKEETFDASNTLTTTQSRVFDSLNRLWQEIGYVNLTTPRTTTYTYDANSNLKTRTDPLNHTTTLAYDALNRLSQATDALAGITVYGYDPLDQVTRITDPRLAATNYTVNALGEPAQQVSPDSGTTARTFDAAGNPKTETDARGVTASYAYDALNRPTNVSYPVAGENILYTWDSAAGCTYGIGRLCQVSDAAGQTSFAYDAQGNLAQQTRLEAGVTSITRYAYNAANRPAAVITPTGEALSLTRNGAGRIAQVTATNGAASTVLAQQLRYNGVGQVTAQTLGNGVTQTSSFDLSGQVSAQAATTGGAVSDGDIPTLPEWGMILMGGLLLFTMQRRPRMRAGVPSLAVFGLAMLLSGALGAPAAWADATLQYDAAGNVIQRTTAQGATTYTYDALDRLNSEAGPAKTQTFSYDANGNRLSDGAGSYTYPATGNKMSTRLGVAVTHDAAGDLTADGSGKTFVYNQAGQLYQVKQGTTLLASYYYNYQGQRSRKVTTAAAPQGAQTVLYHYDLQGHLIAETSGTGAALRTYAWRDDAPVAQIEHVPSRKILYYELDHLNTPRAAADDTGKVVWRWESDAFGSSAANEDPDGDGVKTTVNLRFAGQYRDAESSLHYNYFRSTYNPATGRYGEVDPIGLAGGINPYQYANSNPLTFTDPLGLDPAGAAIGGAIGTWGGRVIGGAVGTVVEPGGGTILGGAAGGAIGNKIGSAAGNAIGDIIKKACEPDDCNEITAKIQDVMKQLTRRYMHQCRNKKNQWESHVPAFENTKRQLAKLVTQAEAKGCPVPSEAYEWLKTECPIPGTPRNSSPGY